MAYESGENHKQNILAESAITEVVLIYSKHHLLISICAGLLLGIIFAGTVSGTLRITLYAGVIGVGIDIDHFVISRINTGDWSALIDCVRNPLNVVTAQQVIFDEVEVKSPERISSHLLISGVSVPVIWSFTPRWAIITAIVLYLHILSDALADASAAYQY